jgi:outer membrane protein TolC
MRGELRPRTLINRWLPRLALAAIPVVPAAVSATDLTLEEALRIARERTARGSIIDGQLEVAEQTYQARRTNFYFPAISVNGQIPSYNLDESYRNIYGISNRVLARSTDLGFRSFIEAKQSLITGGDLSVTANLTRHDEEYPIAEGTGLTDIREVSRQAFFEFNLTQPLLKPSEVKHDLNKKRDDYELARLTRLDDLAALEKEVVEAYMGVLRLSLAQSLAEDRLDAARHKAGVDSAKFADGVISEEAYLTSISERLDAELGVFEARTEADEKRRELAMLLDLEPTDSLATAEPAVNGTYDPTQSQSYINRWENSVTVERARLQYEKARRQARFAASSHGINGDLSLKYSLGRGNIDTDGMDDVDINTNRWQVAVNFSLPIWDGGASGAAVQAAELEAEQSRLAFVESERSAKGQIINLVNRLDVSYRRLDIVKQQIQLSENRLDIARSRYDDGQISRLTYLERRISYLETKDKYLEELKTFLLNRIDLESALVG